jgi:serine/threonine protein kinase
MPDNQIGRYLIQSELGQGGMASVYLAYDPAFKRQVAIKLLPDQYLENSILRRRFDREAQAIASTEHPAIVPVYDFGEDHNRPFLVMRYMSGGSLNDRLRAGPLSLKEAAYIVQQVSPGLDHVHEMGIVHRDLKPGNILFDHLGNAYISDFGIAQLSNATTVLTRESILGTPSYMSPEQVVGERNLDGRSDIYALGVIVFQMLCGRTPFTAPTPMALALKHINEPVPSLCALRPGLPPQIDALIQQALAKLPEERFATAHALSVALNGMLEQPELFTRVATPPKTGDSYNAPASSVATVRTESLPPPPVQRREPQPNPLATLPVQEQPSAPLREPTGAPPRQPPAAPPPRMAPPGAQGQKRPATAWIASGLLGIALLGVAVVCLGAAGYWLFLRPAAATPTPQATFTPAGAAAPAATATHSPATATAAPSSTPGAAASPTAPAAAGSSPTQPFSTVVGGFSDDFSTPQHGWPVASDDNASYGYEEGHYQIWVLVPQWSYYTVSDLHAADIHVEADAALAYGDEANFFGLVCRYQDADNHYFFEINGKGEYTIGKVTGGQTTNLLPDSPGSSPLINQGNATNRLTADCLGSTLSFWANGNKLAEVVDSSLDSGQAGFVVKTMDEGDTIVNFDNFSAR